MKRVTQDPPDWILKFIRSFCDQDIAEGIEGDLYEEYFDLRVRKGAFKSNIIIVLSALSLIKYHLKKKSKKNTMKTLWLNYIKVSLRSMKRNLTYTLINTVGMVIGISCTLYAISYTADELSFDKHHKDADHIYRVYKRYLDPTEDIDFLTYETSGMMGPTMYQEFPQIESFLRVCPWFDKSTVTYNNSSILTESVYIADSNFFDFFDFEVLLGNKESMLVAPSSIALSQSVAKSLFGSQNPIGKVVLGLNDIEYEITGVFEDIGRKSSMQFDAVISWSTTEPGIGPTPYRWMNNWLAQSIYTFVKAPFLSTPDDLSDQFESMMEEHLPERADQYYLKLKPFRDMHLKSGSIRSNRGMKFGSITFVYLLGLSAFFILLISVVNYINITLSKTSDHSKEIGIRKTFGSSRNQLRVRFMSETFLILFISLTISTVVLALTISQLNYLLDKDLALLELLNPLYIVFVILLGLVLATLVGLYPAFILSKPQVTEILKGRNVSIKSGHLRKVLLVIQYSLSIFLVFSSLIAIQQVDFLINKPLGFTKENLIVIDTYNEVGAQIEVFENKLISHPNIESVSVSRHTIGSSSYTTTVLPENSQSELTARIFGVDTEFFSTFKLNVAAGRLFKAQSRADSLKIVINQKLSDMIGWENPIGKTIQLNENGPRLEIIGIVGDFHYNSVASHEIEPVLMYYTPDASNNCSIRVGDGNLKETMDFIVELWDELATRTSLDFYFVDSWFESKYKNETRMLKISTIYASISILICLLGLYGLVGLLLQRRRKEIAIRRVLGAKSVSILNLVSKDFVWLLLVSLIISLPISYILGENWLESFAYKIKIGVWPIIVSIFIPISISISVILYLAMRAIGTNPSQNLNEQ